MATLHDTVVPRKRLATYGKASRRRIPEFSFPSTSRRLQTPEVHSQPELQTAPSHAPTSTLGKLKSPRQRSVSVSRTASPPNGDVFDVPSSDDEAPRSARKSATPPAKQPKLKATRQRSVTRTVSSVSSPSRNIFNVPEDEEGCKPIQRLVQKKAILPPAVDQKLKTSRAIAQSKPVSAISAPGGNIFDVPEDEEAPKLVHKPVQKKTILPPAAVKPLRPVPKSKTASPASATGGDIFDVPSSGDEAPTPKAVHKVPAAVTKLNLKPPTQKPPTDIVEDLRSRKKMKMSPAPVPLLKRLPVNTVIRSPKPKTVPVSISRPGRAKDRQTTPSAGQFMKVVARPKIPPPSPKRSELPSTPQKPSPAPQSEHGAFSAPSPSLSDIVMMDVDPAGTTLSPRGLQLWQGLLESAEEVDENMSDYNDGIDHRITRSRSATPGVRMRTLSKPAGVSKKGSPKLPRRRLIDTLVAQQEESDGSEEEEAGLSQSMVISAQQEEQAEVIAAISRSQSVIPDSHPAILSESQMSQISGPRFTYSSKQRSMLEEQDLMQELALGMPSQPAQPGGRRGRRASIPILNPLASFQDEDDEDSTLNPVRNVHELRKAGANNRFIDEVQDYLERIGKPDSTKLSMRRSGLLDLASKMKDKEFAEKFRANGMELKLFLHLGQEQDVVSAYLMVSLLITVLVDNMPHVIAQLRRQGITRLLIRLMDCRTSIAAVTRDRKTNMSKVAQTLVAEHHDYLLTLPLWDQYKPPLIAPRTLALKCIERMVRQTREAGIASDIFSKELTTNLFSILKLGSVAEWWNLPNDRQAIDFHLALSALESHSIAARTVHDESIWISDYLPIVTETLETALSRPLDTFGEQQLLLLRLTVNVTNNNPKAADVFAQPGLMAVLGRLLVEKFKQISRFLREDEFAIVIDQLILALGVMINLADRSSAVRESLQSLEGNASDPLDSIIQIFLDNLDRTSLAESEQESNKNVAFGYLSVMLGYCSLLPAISKRIEAKERRVKMPKTSRGGPLMTSIQEFIGHHKTVDRQIAQDEDGHNPQAGLTERLERLVNKLAELKGLKI